VKQSESIALLATALCAAQSEMGGAVKDSANPFFKSKYADLGSVVKAIKEPFTKHGLSYVQFPYTDDRGIGVVTRLIHASGEWLESEFTLPMVKHDPQAAGAAITYARRYALQSMAGIPTADDDAESAMYRTDEEYTPEQRTEFMSLLTAGDGWGLKQFAADAGLDAITALFNSFGKGEISKNKQRYRDLVGSANTAMKDILEALRLALDGVARKVATSVPSPETPVDIGSPVQFVRVPLVGVPRIGAVRVRTLVLELNGRLAFVLGPRSPVAAVKNARKQDVSVASFATVICVGMPPEGVSQVIVPPVFHVGTCPLLGVSEARVATTNVLAVPS